MQPHQDLTILLLGSGGREHALAVALAASPSVGRLVAAPGNPGIASVAELMPLRIDDPASVVELARQVDAHLIVVGPEAPLAAGVADALASEGYPVFGPVRAAARLEWDKAFAKDFMRRYGIPTSSSATFTADEVADARRYVEAHALPVVIKASGLAAGKGVVIAQTTSEALAELDRMLSGGAFGEAGRTVVVEEFMEGEEASVFAVCDGEHYVVLAPSQDHKRIGDGDTGPNTGGMGAYAPAPVVTAAVLETVRREVIELALDGMRREGTPYVGCLYAGLMIDGARVRVVEFNCRFGDPETQVVLPLYDGDVGALLMMAATGGFTENRVAEWRGAAACIVMASSGYPGSYRAGVSIRGIDEAEAKGALVFHAGTSNDGTGLVTAGGRVLGVTCVDEDGDLGRAIARAYEAAPCISFEGAYYRTDIGARALPK